MARALLLIIGLPLVEVAGFAVIGGRIGAAAAVSGRLRPVPDGPARAAFAEDRAGMIANGMLLGEGEPFESLMERCAALEERANRPRANGGPG